MTYAHSTTKQTKGKHLTAIERGQIAAWQEEKLSHGEMSRRLDVIRQTLSNELTRGTVKQEHKVNGVIHYYYKYDPIYAQNCYEEKR